MSTSREWLQAALERAKVRHGSDSPIVTMLQQQIDALPQAGEGAQETFLSQGLPPRQDPTKQ